MNCPHCGAQVIPGSRFCNKCRKRIAPGGAGGHAPASRRPTAAPRPIRPEGAGGAGPGFTRPGLVTLLAVLNLLGGLAALGFSAFMVFALVAADGGSEGTGIVVAIFGAYAVVGTVQLATGVGLFRLAPWGRTLQIVLAGVGLLGIPCGTIISILILIYMLKPEMKTLFSGIPPQRLPADEVARVEALSHGSGAMVAVAAVVVLFVGVAFIGMVAAIAIPSLLRARLSANESAAIGALRTVISAQAAYGSANGGYGDELECLVEPAMCIPGYPAAGPSFLEESFVAEQRSGYRFRFIPGPPAPAEIVQQGQVSETSMDGWALVAAPIKPGQTGVRGFCADSYGAICFTSDGSVPDATAGECPVDDGVCTQLY